MKRSLSPGKISKFQNKRRISPVQFEHHSFESLGCETFFSVTTSARAGMRSQDDAELSFDETAAY